MGLEKEVIVLFDQSDTWIKRRDGGEPRFVEKPPPNDEIEILLESGLDFELSASKVEFFTGLSPDVVNSPISYIHSLSYFVEYLKSRPYRVWGEQEEALVSMVNIPGVSCTLVSSMPAEFWWLAWNNLGPVGRAFVDKDRQMILRRDKDSVISKIIATGLVKQRYGAETIWIENDRSIAKTLSRFFNGMCVFLTSETSQKEDDPKVWVPQCLNNRTENVYDGSGMRDALNFLQGI